MQALATAISATFDLPMNAPPKCPGSLASSYTVDGIRPDSPLYTYGDMLVHNEALLAGRFGKDTGLMPDEAATLATVDALRTMTRAGMWTFNSQSGLSNTGLVRELDRAGRIVAKHPREMFEERQRAFVEMLVPLPCAPSLTENAVAAGFVVVDPIVVSAPPDVVLEEALTMQVMRGETSDEMRCVIELTQFKQVAAGDEMTDAQVRQRLRRTEWTTSTRSPTQAPFPPEVSMNPHISNELKGWLMANTQPMFFIDLRWNDKRLLPALAAMAHECPKHHHQ